MTHKWKICGLLLLALLLNYMDRQTLSLTISPISRELGLNNAQYGEIERGFSLAFAYGGLVAGFLVDRFNVRWLYPLFLLGWSLAGVATGYADWVGRTLAPFGNLWWAGGIDPQNTTETSYFGFAARFWVRSRRANGPVPWWQHNGCFRRRIARRGTAFCKVELL